MQGMYSPNPNVPRDFLWQEYIVHTCEECGKTKPRMDFPRMSADSLGVLLPYYCLACVEKSMRGKDTNTAEAWAEAGYIPPSYLLSRDRTRREVQRRKCDEMRPREDFVSSTASSRFARDDNPQREMPRISYKEWALDVENFDGPVCRECIVFVIDDWILAEDWRKARCRPGDCTWTLCHPEWCGYIFDWLPDEARQDFKRKLSDAFLHNVHWWICPTPGCDSTGMTVMKNETRTYPAIQCYGCRDTWPTLIAGFTAD